MIRRVLAVAFVFVSANAWAQGATPAPLSKVTVSNEVAKRTLMKMQINAETAKGHRRFRASSFRRRAPRRNDLYFHPWSDGGHCPRPRNGRRAARSASRPLVEGQDGALCAILVSAVAQRFKHGRRPSDSARPRQGGGPRLLFSSAVVCRSSSRIS